MTHHTPMKPCPFCEGPPSLIVQNFIGGGEAPLKDNYDDEDGLMVRAFVFCHECGSEGPSTTPFLDTRQDYHDTEREAVRLWNERDARHRAMYDSSEARGLAFYPRKDTP